MKQIFLKSFCARCLILLVLALLSTNLAWGETYTINFVKGTVNGTNISSQLPTNASTMCESGSNYIASFSGTNVYYQSNGCGIRLAKSGDAGSFVITLSNDIQTATIKEVIIYASAVASGNTIDVTTAGTVTTKTTFSSLSTYSTSAEISTYAQSAIPINGTLTSLTFGATSKKYVHLHRIDIVTADEPDPEEPYLSVSPTTIDFGTVYQKADVDAQQVTVSFANLTTNDVAAAISGSAFSINKTSSFTSGDKITISPNTANLGEYEETLTLSATGVDNQTVTVKMNVVTAPVLETYNKVTAISDLAEGDIIVLASSTTAYGIDPGEGHAYIDAMKFTDSQSASLSGNVLKAADAYELTLVKSGDNWTMTSTDGLVGTTADKTMTFGSSDSKNVTTWAISIDGSANASITSTTSSYGKIQYNSSSPRFLNYTSSQTAIQIYKKEVPPTNEAVTFVAPEGGSLVIKNGETPIASGATIQNGTVLDVTFGMTPAEAYKDVAIKVTNTSTSEDVTEKVYDATKKQITMPRYAITVAVTSTKLYKISLVTDGEGTGTATMNDVTTDIYVDGETQINLVANAVAPNEFTSWSATEKILINEVSKAETYAFASGDGTITATFGISALLPLNAPTLSAPTNITYSGVTLNWEALDNAEAYNVELLLNDETVASDVITGATSWTPEVTLQANTTYTYTVQGVGDGVTYAEENNPKATSTFTTYDYPAVVLTLSENGITSTIDGKLNTPIDLPTTSTQTCEDKVFVGWSATTIDGETDTEPSLLGATYTFTDPEQLTATIYAVFAEKSEGEVTWNKVSAVANVEVGEYVVINNSFYLPNTTTSSSPSQVAAPTITDNKIADAGVTAAMKWILSDAGEGKFYVKNSGGDYLYATNDNSGIRVGKTSDTWTFEANDGALAMKESSNSRYCATYKSGSDWRSYTSANHSNYGDGGKLYLYKKTQSITYSKFCTTVVTKVLESISLSGDYPTVFWKGEAFSHEGMTVIAHYDDESTKDVTASAEFSGYDMANAGEQTVIVTYGTQSTTYDITVKTIANTPETAYTTAEAKELIDAGNDLGTEVYVKGIVSKIETPWSEEFNNITYNISEDGETSSSQFQLYRCVTNGAVAGDYVIAKGKMQKHGGTYEFKAGNIIVNSVNMSITEAKWGTFCAPFNVTIPDGVKAYTADASGDEVAFTEVTTTIPAGTPVVVYSAGIVNKYYFGALSTEETCTEGALVGVYTATSGITAEANYTNYVLQNNAQGVGFYKVGETSTISLKANRCYMTLPTTADVKPFFAFDDMADGICRILNGTDKSAEGIYDLNGCKLTAPRKGVNIINGVKVLVK